MLRKPTKPHGKLIAFEGIDGSGKTTQAYLLVKKLKEEGYRVVYTAEPTYGYIGDVLRLHVFKQTERSPIVEALLFAADRYIHVHEQILPALRNGNIVVSDRYVYSSIAYQGAGGAKLPWLREVNYFAPKPDLTLLLDVDSKLGLNRKGASNVLFEDLNFEGKVRRVYLQLAEENNFTVIDASKPLMAVHRNILEATKRKLRLP